MYIWNLVEWFVFNVTKLYCFIGGFSRTGRKLFSMTSRFLVLEFYLECLWAILFRLGCDVISSIRGKKEPSAHFIQKNGESRQIIAIDNSNVINSFYVTCSWGQPLANLTCQSIRLDFLSCTTVVCACAYIFTFS